MQTFLNLEGANCPTCFNETIEDLSRLEGVESVHGSFSGPCLEVEHSEGVLETIKATIRKDLHGIVMFAGEKQMVGLEPTVIAKSCAHDVEVASSSKIIDPSMKLGDIVTQNPSLAIEFEKRGLDYCCQGSRTLSDAAEKAGVDAQTLANELTQAMIDETPEEWSSLSPVDLVDNIESIHHTYLWDNFDRIQALVEKIANVHGERHPELIEVQRLWNEIRADFEPHLKKEEQILFPMIRKLALSGEQNEPESEIILARIRSLSGEHEVVGELLAELNRITNGYTTPADGCATYAACYQALAEVESDTHLHIHKESNVLFPALKAEPTERWSVSFVS